MSSDQALIVQVLAKYLQLWDLVDGLVLLQGVPDQCGWKFTQPGSYSSKSAYAASFWGPSGLLLGQEFGRAGLPCAANFQLVSYQQSVLVSQLSCQARVASSVCLPFL